MENDFLTKRIISYMNEKTPSNYAILLRGEWGSGKTSFCKSIINELDSDDVWYISAFGIKNRSDIDDKLFEAAHPIWSKNGGKHVTAIGYSLLRTIGKYKLDVDIDDIKRTVLSVIKENDGGKQCSLLFVDDVERSAIKMREFMGYFSSLLEDGVHIVFIANENEIKQSCEYELFKEKIIGEVYEINPDFHKIIRNFWDEEQMPREENFIKHLINIYEIVGNNNLRIVRQSLHQWKIFSDILLPTFKQDKEFMSDLFLIYFVLKLQHKRNPRLFTLDDRDEIKKRIYFRERCQDAWSAFKRYKMPLTEYNEQLNDEKSEIHRSHTMDNIFSPLILADTWYDILVLGRDSDHSWIGEVLEDLYETKKKQHDKVKKALNTSMEIMRKVVFSEIAESQIDVKTAYENLCSDFQSGQYCSFGDCMAFIQISLKLLQDEIIPSECYQNMKSILKKFITENGDKIIFDNHFEPNETKLPKVSDPIIQQYINQLFDCGMKNLTAESENIFKNKIKFFELIQNPTHALNKYLEVPILSKIDIDIIFGWIESKKDMEMHHNLLRFLKYRYGYNIENINMNPAYYPDYNNILKLRDKYEKRYNELKGKYQPAVKIYKDFWAKYNAMVEYMNEFVPNKNDTRQSDEPH